MATPQEIIDKVVFGGLYEVSGGVWNNNGGLNDQAYYLAVPVMDSDGNLWMQDTYQLDRPSKKSGENVSDAAIREICGFGEGYNGYCVKRARWDYYYKNQRKIMTEDDLSGFDLICDMHDYRALEPWEDYRDYKSEDVVHYAILFREHNFNWNRGRTLGATLVRKNANKDSVRILEKTIQDAYANFKYPKGWWKISSVDDAVKQCAEDGTLTDELSVKASAVKMLNGKLEEMRTEIDSLINMMKEQ